MTISKEWLSVIRSRKLYGCRLNRKTERIKCKSRIRKFRLDRNLPLKGLSLLNLENNENTDIVDQLWKEGEVETFSTSALDVMSSKSESFTEEESILNVIMDSSTVESKGFCSEFAGNISDFKVFYLETIYDESSEEEIEINNFMDRTVSFVNPQERSNKDNQLTVDNNLESTDSALFFNQCVYSVEKLNTDLQSTEFSSSDNIRAPSSSDETATDDTITEGNQSSVESLPSSSNFPEVCKLHYTPQDDSSMESFKNNMKQYQSTVISKKFCGGLTCKLKHFKNKSSFPTIPEQPSAISCKFNAIEFLEESKEKKMSKKEGGFFKFLRKCKFGRSRKSKNGKRAEGKELCKCIQNPTELSDTKCITQTADSQKMMLNAPQQNMGVANTYGVFTCTNKKQSDTSISEESLNAQVENMYAPVKCKTKNENPSRRNPNSMDSMQFMCTVNGGVDISSSEHSFQSWNALPVKDVSTYNSKDSLSEFELSACSSKDSMQSLSGISNLSTSQESLQSEILLLEPSQKTGFPKYLKSTRKKSKKKFTQTDRRKHKKVSCSKYSLERNAPKSSTRCVFKVNTSSSMAPIQVTDNTCLCRQMSSCTAKKPKKHKKSKKCGASDGGTLRNHNRGDYSSCIQLSSKELKRLKKKHSKKSHKRKQKNRCRCAEYASSYSSNDTTTESLSASTSRLKLPMQTVDHESQAPCRCSSRNRKIGTSTNSLEAMQQKRPHLDVDDSVEYFICKHPNVCIEKKSAESFDDTYKRPKHHRSKNRIQNTCSKCSLQSYRSSRINPCKKRHKSASKHKKKMLKQAKSHKSKRTTCTPKLKASRQPKCLRGTKADENYSYGSESSEGSEYEHSKKCRCRDGTHQEKISVPRKKFESDSVENVKLKQMASNSSTNCVLFDRVCKKPMLSADSEKNKHSNKSTEHKSKTHKRSNASRSDESIQFEREICTLKPTRSDQSTKRRSKKCYIEVPSHPKPRHSRRKHHKKRKIVKRTRSVERREYTDSDEDVTSASSGSTEDSAHTRPKSHRSKDSLQLKKYKRTTKHSVKSTRKKQKRNSRDSSQSIRCTPKDPNSKHHSRTKIKRSRKYSCTEISPSKRRSHSREYKIPSQSDSEHSITSTDSNQIVTKKKALPEDIMQPTENLPQKTDVENNKPTDAKSSKRCYCKSVNPEQLGQKQDTVPTENVVKLNQSLEPSSIPKENTETKPNTTTETAPPNNNELPQTQTRNSNPCMCKQIKKPENLSICSKCSLCKKNLQSSANGSSENIQPKKNSTEELLRLKCKCKELCQCIQRKISTQPKIEDANITSKSPPPKEEIPMSQGSNEPTQQFLQSKNGNKDVSAKSNPCRCKKLKIENTDTIKPKENSAGSNGFELTGQTKKQTSENNSEEFPQPKNKDKNNRCYCKQKKAPNQSVSIEPSRSEADETQELIDMVERLRELCRKLKKSTPESSNQNILQSKNSFDLNSSRLAMCKKPKVCSSSKESLQSLDDVFKQLNEQTYDEKINSSDLITGSSQEQVSSKRPVCKKKSSTNSSKESITIINDPCKDFLYREPRQRPPRRANLCNFTSRVKPQSASSVELILKCSQLKRVRPQDCKKLTLPKMMVYRKPNSCSSLEYTRPTNVQTSRSNTCTTQDSADDAYRPKPTRDNIQKCPRKINREFSQCTYFKYNKPSLRDSIEIKHKKLRKLNSIETILPYRTFRKKSNRRLSREVADYLRTDLSVCNVQSQSKRLSSNRNANYSVKRPQNFHSQSSKNRSKRKIKRHFSSNESIIVREMTYQESNVCSPKQPAQSSGSILKGSNKCGCRPRRPKSVNISSSEECIRSKPMSQIPSTASTSTNYTSCSNLTQTTTSCRSKESSSSESDVDDYEDYIKPKCYRNDEENRTPVTPCKYPKEQKTREHQRKGKSCLLSQILECESSSHLSRCQQNKQTPYYTPVQKRENVSSERNYIQPQYYENPVPHRNTCSPKPAPNRNTCIPRPVPSQTTCIPKPVPNRSTCTSIPVPNRNTCTPIPVPNRNTCTPIPVPNRNTCTPIPVPNRNTCRTQNKGSCMKRTSSPTQCKSKKRRDGCEGRLQQKFCLIKRDICDYAPKGSQCANKPSCAIGSNQKCQNMQDIFKKDMGLIRRRVECKLKLPSQNAEEKKCVFERHFSKCYSPSYQCSDRVEPRCSETSICDYSRTQLTDSGKCSASSLRPAIKTRKIPCTEPPCVTVSESCESQMPTETHSASCSCSSLIPKMVPKCCSSYAPNPPSINSCNSACFRKLTRDEIMNIHMASKRSNCTQAGVEKNSAACSCSTMQPQCQIPICPSGRNTISRSVSCNSSPTNCQIKPKVSVCTDVSSLAPVKSCNTDVRKSTGKTSTGCSCTSLIELNPKKWACKETKITTIDKDSFQLSNYGLGKKVDTQQNIGGCRNCQIRCNDCDLKRFIMSKIEEVRRNAPKKPCIEKKPAMCSCYSFKPPIKSGTYSKITITESDLENSNRPRNPKIIYRYKNPPQKNSLRCECSSKMNAMNDIRCLANTNATKGISTERSVSRLRLITKAIRQPECQNNERFTGHKHSCIGQPIKMRKNVCGCKPIACQCSSLALRKCASSAATHEDRCLEDLRALRRQLEGKLLSHNVNRKVGVVQRRSVKCSASEMQLKKPKVSLSIQACSNDEVQRIVRQLTETLRGERSVCKSHSENKCIGTLLREEQPKKCVTSISNRPNCRISTGTCTKSFSVENKGSQCTVKSRYGSVKSICSSLLCALKSKSCTGSQTKTSCEIAPSGKCVYSETNKQIKRESNCIPRRCGQQKTFRNRVPNSTCSSSTVTISSDKFADTGTCISPRSTGNSGRQNKADSVLLNASCGPDITKHSVKSGSSITNCTIKPKRCYISNSLDQEIQSNECILSSFKKKECVNNQTSPICVTTAKPRVNKPNINIIGARGRCSESSLKPSYGNLIISIKSSKCDFPKSSYYPTSNATVSINRGHIQYNATCSRYYKTRCFSPSRFCPRPRELRNNCCGRYSVLKKFDRHVRRDCTHLLPKCYVSGGTTGFISCSNDMPRSSRSCGTIINAPVDDLLSLLSQNDVRSCLSLPKCKNTQYRCSDVICTTPIDTNCELVVVEEQSPNCRCGPCCTCGTCRNVCTSIAPAVSCRSKNICIDDCGVINHGASLCSNATLRCPQSRSSCLSPGRSISREIRTYCPTNYARRLACDYVPNCRGTQYCYDERPNLCKSCDEGPKRIKVMEKISVLLPDSKNATNDLCRNCLKRCASTEMYTVNPSSCRNSEIRRPNCRGVQIEDKVNLASQCLNLKRVVTEKHSAKCSCSSLLPRLKPKQCDTVHTNTVSFTNCGSNVKKINKDVLMRDISQILDQVDLFSQCPTRKASVIVKSIGCSCSSLLEEQSPKCVTTRTVRQCCKPKCTQKPSVNNCLNQKYKCSRELISVSPECGSIRSVSGCRKNRRPIDAGVSCTIIKENRCGKKPSVTIECKKIQDRGCTPPKIIKTDFSCSTRANLATSGTGSSKTICPPLRFCKTTSCTTPKVYRKPSCKRDIVIESKGSIRSSCSSCTPKRVNCLSRTSDCNDCSELGRSVNTFLKVLGNVIGKGDCGQDRDSIISKSIEELTISSGSSQCSSNACPLNQFHSKLIESLISELYCRDNAECERLDDRIDCLTNALQCTLIEPYLAILKKRKGCRKTEVCRSPKKRRCQRRNRLCLCQIQRTDFSNRLCRHNVINVCELSKMYAGRPDFPCNSNCASCRPDRNYYYNAVVPMRTTPMCSKYPMSSAHNYPNYYYAQTSSSRRPSAYSVCNAACSKRKKKTRNKKICRSSFMSNDSACR